MLCRRLPVRACPDGLQRAEAVERHGGERRPRTDREPDAKAARRCAQARARCRARATWGRGRGADRRAWRCAAWARCSGSGLAGDHARWAALSFTPSIRRWTRQMLVAARARRGAGLLAAAPLLGAAAGGCGARAAGHRRLDLQRPRRWCRTSAGSIRSPASARVFSLRGLIELGKALARFVVVAVVAVVVLSPAVPQLLAASAPSRCARGIAHALSLIGSAFIALGGALGGDRGGRRAVGALAVPTIAAHDAPGDARRAQGDRGQPGESGRACAACSSRWRASA